MNQPEKIEYSEKELSELVKFLKKVDRAFSPALSHRVSLPEYADKILQRAEVFGIYDAKHDLVASFAVYANNHTSGVAYVSFIATASMSRGKGLGSKLIDCMISRCRELNMRYIKLEVCRQNQVAIKLYTKFGFRECADQASITRSEASAMILPI